MANTVMRVNDVSLMLSERGTSLLELLGAMVAGLVVLGATLQSLNYFQQQFVRQQNGLIQEQDLRLSLEVLEDELRQARTGSFSTMLPDQVEFTANVHGFQTNVTAEAAIGQTTLSVNDGRGWPDRKAVLVCWNDHCEEFTLARAGQRYLLTFIEPTPRMIPVGAAVTVSNRVRYYGRSDERGSLRLLRQIDGGASVLVGDIDNVRFSYWDERGQVTAQPARVRRIVVEVSRPHQASKAVREINFVSNSI